MSTTVATAPEDIDSVIQNHKHVLLKFHAKWCSPCKALSPIVDEVAALQSLKVVNIDVDENAQATMKYRIRGIPALILFRDGHPIAYHIGAANRDRINDFICDNLNSNK